MTETQQARLHAIIEGRVQGVGFRYFVVESAQALGATGWVRNRWDDTVEVVAEGDREMLERLLTQLKRGPQVAFVSDVIVDWEPYTGEFGGFRVRQTY